MNIIEIGQSWIASIKPNPEQKSRAEHRLEICNNCEHCEFSKTFNTHLCNLCWCPIKKKIFSPKQGSCPLKKWQK